MIHIQVNSSWLRHRTVHNCERRSHSNVILGYITVFRQATTETVRPWGLGHLIDFDQCWPSCPTQKCHIQQHPTEATNSNNSLRSIDAVLPKRIGSRMFKAFHVFLFCLFSAFGSLKPSHIEICHVTQGLHSNMTSCHAQAQKDQVEFSGRGWYHQKFCCELIRVAYIQS